MPTETLRRLATSRTLWVAIACIGSFWLVSAFLPFVTMMEFLNGVALAVAIAVTIAYAPVWVEALTQDRPDRVGQLTLGIGCTWGAFILSRMWSISWRGSGQPDWMENSPVVGFFVYMTILGGILHLTAPGAIDGDVPRRNWILIGITIGGGLVLGLAFLGWRVAHIFEPL